MFTKEDVIMKWGHEGGWWGGGEGRAREWVVGGEANEVTPTSYIQCLLLFSHEHMITEL